MKKIIYSLLVGAIVILITQSCAQDFLEKPLGGNVTIDTVFSSKVRAQSAIASAYFESLVAGINFTSFGGDYGMNGGNQAHLSDEMTYAFDGWQDDGEIKKTGMKPFKNGSTNAFSEDGFQANWRSIRKSYLVIENIDKVADMTEVEKNQVKAEMKVLIAYRYEEMFKRYGGIPIVTKVLTLTDELKLKRATLQETLDFIVKLCDEAAPLLPDGYSATFQRGHVTKGVALGVKAEALIFAARPLFNSATPYMNLGENNNLICFGNYDQSRWQKAADASKAVTDWAASSGWCQIINTNNPLTDYGTACAGLDNNELLLTLKYQWNNDGDGIGLYRYYGPWAWETNTTALPLSFLKNYVKADGTEQIWDETLNTFYPYSSFAAKINQMEPRFKATFAAPGFDAWINIGSADYTSVKMFIYDKTGMYGIRCIKFWNGVTNRSTRKWFEFPVYRLAEFYLYQAEANNELGQSNQALTNLNVIHNRAGLPSVTQTNKDNLRQIIQKEIGVEFFYEGHRLFDVKHWKLSNIGTSIIGGPLHAMNFTWNSAAPAGLATDYKEYRFIQKVTGFWNSSQYLEPIPQSEVNKGFLIQNPGY